MKSNGRLLSQLTPDFRVEFADGGTFTSDEGTWDDCPRGRAISALAHGRLRLDGHDEYSFGWEGVGVMPVGRSINIASPGQIVAIHLYARTGDKGTVIRIDLKDRSGMWSGDVRELDLRVTPDRWRGKAGVTA